MNTRPMPDVRCPMSCSQHVTPATPVIIDIGHRTSDIGPLRWWSRIRSYLRAWSGDDAYDRYLAEHHLHGHALLSRREFYRRYLDHRAGGSRCC